MKINYLFTFMLGLIVAGLSVTQARDYSEKTVPIVAVDSSDNEGFIGYLTLQKVPGNNKILIETSPYLKTDIQYSSNIAIEVAELLSNNKFKAEDLIFSYDIDASIVGGTSAGAASTIAALALLKDAQIKEGVAITGSILTNGDIGPVSGLIEKAKALEDEGYDLFLVPKGQSKIKYYNFMSYDNPFSRSPYRTELMSRMIDIGDIVDIEVIEVQNITEAAEYILI